MDPTKDLAWREALEFPEDWDVDFGEDQQDEEDELDDGFMEEDELGEKGMDEEFEEVDDELEAGAEDDLESNEESPGNVPGEQPPEFHSPAWERPHRLPEGHVSGRQRTGWSSMRNLQRPPTAGIHPRAAFLSSGLRLEGPAKRSRAASSLEEEEPQRIQKRRKKIIKIKVSLKPAVAEKLGQLTARSIKLTAHAVRGLAAADAKDALVLLQDLLSHRQVAHPSRFVMVSLQNLKKKAGEAPPDSKVRALRAPAGTAECQAAKPVKVPGQGEPPRERLDLPFERQAVQAKLLALNKLGIWTKGPHPLDESALSALMQIEPARGLEILEEVEAQGVALIDPSRHARELAADEEKVFPP
ncbi:Hypothetical protein SCF082_LOCUS17596 [Durusdinium trenchii]|uniref:Uncharacterized protein n=1 Tax=Durusdinium trenchii TaxID=1381693 RepID=A0ABP0KK52_9DINO